MKTPFTRLFSHRNVKPMLRALGRARLGVLTLALAGLQISCSDTFNVSKSAANSHQLAEGRSLPAPISADFGAIVPSEETRDVAARILRSGDHAGAEFIIVDKRQAMVYVFAATGVLQGSSPVLIGAAVGDDSVPGIGTRPIAEVLPEERTTPAGRFVAERGTNTAGEDVIWVDYDAAVSMHRVRTNNPAERRLERLASASAQDNRISYGCINVPVAFYETVVSPVFRGKRAVVYVLPEVRKLGGVFTVRADSPRT